MDMSGMDTSSMDGSGMDSSSNTNFVGTNMYIASVYWILIGSVLTLLLARRMVDSARRSWRKRQSTRQVSARIARPSSFLAQAYDTTIAIFREASYPQYLHFTHPFGKYFSPPPLGRILALCVYWTVILTMLWSNTILSPDSSLYAYKWEIVGFRAAWVSVTQLPLIYALSCKINVISLITGISYERLNWLHRWIARTLFLTVIVHWSFFFTEWTIADFVSFELQLMPMVKYGFGAWAVITWMVLSSFGFLRAKQYEFFVWQHLAAAGALLWLVYVHVPAYATYNVWLAIAFVAFDRLARGAWTLYRNLHLPSILKSSVSKKSLAVGYKASLDTLAGDFVRVTIPNIPFSWKAGQHIFLSVPSLGLGQSHPFTISNTADSAPGSGTRSLELYIHARGGITRKILDKAKTAQASNSPASVRAFVSGPFGMAPQVDSFETVVLLAASSGASFSTPIFQSLAKNPFCARRIFFYWVVRDSCQLSAFSTQILAAIASAEQSGVEVKVGIFLTGKSSSTEPPAMGSDDVDSSSFSSYEKDAEVSCCDPASGKSCCPPGTCTCISKAAPLPESSDSDGETDVEKGAEKDAATSITVKPLSSSSSQSTSHSRLFSPDTLFKHAAASVCYGCRPQFDTLIRPAVESAEGETYVVGCGSEGFTAGLRTYVARLSDERAVHKGTGAQGIRLWAETYGW